MIPGAIDAAQNTAAKKPSRKAAGRSPLAQLLHALNQPLTGLQCSMEVALAGPRTNEQYVQGLREGLALTERMRALAEAIREVTDIENEDIEEDVETEETQTGKPETAELKSLLGEAVEELRPVAEAKSVRIALDSSFLSSYSSWAVKGRRTQLAGGIFRLVESTLALADIGTVLRIEAGSGANEVWFRVQWQASGAEPRSAVSRPELGLLIAQARLERSGAAWEREATGDREMLTVRLPCASLPSGTF